MFYFVCVNLLGPIGPMGRVGVLFVRVFDDGVSPVCLNGLMGPRSMCFLASVSTFRHLQNSLLIRAQVSDQDVTLLESKHSGRNPGTVLEQHKLVTSNKPGDYQHHNNLLNGQL